MFSKGDSEKKFPTYHGTSSENFNAWAVEFDAYISSKGILKPRDRLKSIDKEKYAQRLEDFEDQRLSALILSLKGDARALFDRMKETEKQDFDFIRNKLKNTFAPKPCRALEKFFACSKGPEESVDSFVQLLTFHLMDVYRVDSLSSDQEYLVAVQFCRGLPDGYVRDMCTASAYAKQTLEQVVTQARDLYDAQTSHSDAPLALGGAGVVAQKSTDKSTASSKSRAVPASSEKKPARHYICLRCGKEGHSAPDCTAEKPLPPSERPQLPPRVWRGKKSM
jgi:hypothetical protein